MRVARRARGAGREGRVGLDRQLHEVARQQLGERRIGQRLPAAAGYLLCMGMVGGDSIRST